MKILHESDRFFYQIKHFLWRKNRAFRLLEPSSRNPRANLYTSISCETICGIQTAQAQRLSSASACLDFHHRQPLMQSLPPRPRCKIVLSPASAPSPPGKQPKSFPVVEVLWICISTALQFLSTARPGFIFPNNFFPCIARGGPGELGIFPAALVISDGRPCNGG